MDYQNLLASLTIRGKVFRNRMLAAPTGFAYFLLGNFSKGMIDMIRSRAEGGQAAVCVGESPVSYYHLPLGRKATSNRRYFDFDSESSEDFKLVQDVASAIHENGALAFWELTHPGAVGMPDERYDTVVGPVSYMRDDGVAVTGLDRDGMAEVCRQFADTALVMKHAGYDGVLLHGGHGFLMTQFLSPLTNTRTDEYGGSLENRARFPLKILQAVRQAVGQDFVIELRVSGSERLDGGVTPEMMAEFASMLGGLVDILHISSGHYFSSYRTLEFSSMYEPHGCNVDLARVISPKTPENVYVSVVGGINSPELAEQLIAEGIVDFISMGRQMFADPAFARKVSEGRTFDIQRCVRCLRCYPGAVEHPQETEYIRKHGAEPPVPRNPEDVFCTVNPSSNGWFFPSVRLTKAEKGKKVLVIGGGTGGMSAAITAYDRGHSVTLVERTDRLGGVLFFTDRETVKADLKNFRDLLIRRVLERAIDVRLHTEATGGMIHELQPDAVVLAVGAAPMVPQIPGIENAVQALDVYQGADELGKRVVIIGGGLVGCDTAVFLAERSHQVQIVELLDRIAVEAKAMQFTSLADRLDRLGVQTHVETKCLAIEKDGVLVEPPDGEQRRLVCDSVVACLGMKPNTGIVETLMRDIPDGTEVYTVGDCKTVARVGEACKQGHLAALQL